MRTEQEMYDLILSVARENDRIRGVYLNGSRANPNAKKDCLQDFDIVYIVTGLEPFLKNPKWIDIFGERVIMQTPEAMNVFPPSMKGRFPYLIQLMDGNRIDLCLIPISQKEQYISEDKMTILLLDKDEPQRKLSKSTDEDYWIKPPTQDEFSEYCNEFWWVSTYVAKGLWRNEILYATEHLNGICRSMLLHILSWKAGLKTNFKVSVGKCGKYLEQYIKKEEWDAFIHSFGNGDVEQTWDALFTVCNLFSKNARMIAFHFNFNYDVKEEEKVITYLNQLRALPKDATSF
ncbi:aminoglycoside 6-adenylyltransferase [Paludicola sp. MB14-C6]|uniref:aminoglycoside 6-adenylyltransferase n=1 Tax=Paludihabitans sp. MB14-C6 TaxID=3070656 RepID=UPI0027DCFF90|nr:aminoglycoside 6-adenylyltransferase [Paludicola sp. MB14-C6]WMJ22807.1 aminoglycoside 6-adenylyltransferase [Paludicola sp. MB14-C6]